MGQEVLFRFVDAEGNALDFEEGSRSYRITDSIVNETSDGRLEVTHICNSIPRMIVGSKSE